MAEEKEPIVFKCEDSLWQMLKSGEKKFDVRRYDPDDERIYRLSRFMLQKTGPRSGVDEKEEPTEGEVSFLNKATGELLTRVYKGLEFTFWAPGWCFILLGEKIREN